jgi:hypothetical protein
LAEFVEERAKSNASKLATARAAGIKFSVPSRTPSEELARLEEVLRAARRTADAESVAARRLAIVPAE